MRRPKGMLSDGTRHLTIKDHNERLGENLRDAIKEIRNIVLLLPSPDMKKFAGTKVCPANAIRRAYGNTCPFHPTMGYPPHMIAHFATDFAQNAQGIYYHDKYRPAMTPKDRTLFIPSIEGVDWEHRDEVDRRKRARVAAHHARSNEAWEDISEYTWDAEARSDIFGKIRDDPHLRMDKHEYNANLSETDEMRCTLTGKVSLVKRVPDLTFGLATFTRQGPRRPEWTDDLCRDRLEKLLLYRKCGLIADPKWGATDLAFAWAVYEAKGLNGDCREARRQACAAGAVYLDMLDHLARTPGPIGIPKRYQSPSSNNYQVFALTSFGPYWHVLVGYRRERQELEHAGTEGMSDDVYIFQKIWTGTIALERQAWELLSLIDQIHEYATTTFRDFVLRHLKPWHEFCEDNYLLDWKSNYNTGRKRKRTCSEDEDLPMPTWVDLLKDTGKRAKLNLRAKGLLAMAIEEEEERERMREVIKRVLPSKHGPKIHVDAAFAGSIGRAGADEAILVALKRAGVNL